MSNKFCDDSVGCFFLQTGTWNEMWRANWRNSNGGLRKPSPNWSETGWRRRTPAWPTRWRRLRAWPDRKTTINTEQTHRETKTHGKKNKKETTLPLWQKWIRKHHFYVTKLSSSGGTKRLGTSWGRSISRYVHLLWSTQVKLPKNLVSWKVVEFRRGVFFGNFALSFQIWGEFSLKFRLKSFLISFALFLPLP